MRVALFEPELGARGPVAGVYALRTGLRALGHQADVVTFTKSGKARIHWGIDTWKNTYGLRFWGTPPDVCEKWTDAVDVLDKYDVILLTEPKQNLHDKEATKKSELPEYVKVLQRVRPPWIAGLFAPQYQPENAPFLEHLIDTPTFCGTFMSYNPELQNCNPLFGRVRLLYHPMPYGCVWELDDPIPTTPVVGMTGRIISNKGQQLLALVGPEVLEAPWRVEMWGSPSVAASACFTFQLYEALAKTRGYETINPPIRIADDNTVVLDIIQPKRWGVKNPTTGAEVYFCGGYTDVKPVYDRIGLHVDATASTYSTFCEYSQFEAMDAGCLPIAPSHMTDSRYRSGIFELEGAVVGLTGLMSEKPRANAIAQREAFEACLRRAIPIVGTDLHREIAMHNRRMLRELQDPGRCGELMIKAATREI